MLEPKRLNPSVDDEQLLINVTKRVREHPEEFATTGAYLDDAYNLPKMRHRRALALKRQRYIEKRSLEDPNVANLFPPDRYAARHDWKRSPYPASFHLLAAALEDALEDAQGALTTDLSRRIALLTWLIYDELATDFSPRICVLQEIPWSASPELVWPCRFVLQLSYLTPEWMGMLRRAWARLSLVDAGLASNGEGVVVESGSEGHGPSKLSAEDLLKARLSGQPRERALKALKNLEGAAEWVSAMCLDGMGMPKQTAFSASRSAVKDRDYRGGGSTPMAYSRSWLTEFIVHKWTPRPSRAG